MEIAIFTGSQNCSFPEISSQMEHKLGKILLIENDIKIKFLWKLVRFERIVPCCNNKIHSYEVKTELTKWTPFDVKAI